MKPEPTPNPFVYNTDPELNVIFDKLLGLKLRVDERLKKAERIAGLGSGDEAISFKQLKSVTVTLPSFSSLRSPNSWGGKVSLEIVEQKAKEIIDAARREIEEVEKFNEPLRLHNVTIVQQIKDLLQRVGLTETYTTYEFPTARSKTKKTIPHTAGYINDLNRIIPKSNTFESKHNLTEYERRLTSYLQSEKVEEQKQAIASDATAVDKYIVQHPELIKLLIVSADIDIMSLLSRTPAGNKRFCIKDSIKRAIQILLSKNKYLCLAYWLEKNRNDWNDGHDYAQTGLNNFTIEDQTDQEIYNDIQHYIDNWEGDGRVFRDCKWNYSVLYQMVSTEQKQPELVEQLAQLSQLLDE